MVQVLLSQKQRGGIIYRAGSSVEPYLMLDGETNEKPSDQQKHILLLLAQEKNREANRLGGGKCDREGYPHFWKGADASPKSQNAK